MSEFEENIKKFINAKPSSDGFVGNCPNHPDENRSLSVKFRGEESPLFHCFAGCHHEEVKTRLNEHNLLNRTQKINFKMESLLEKTLKESIELFDFPVGQKYFKNRGLEITPEMNLHELKFNLNLYHKDSEGNVSHKPAVIGKIKKNGKLIGIQRIYLTENYLKFEQPKVLGEVSDGYIEIGGSSNDELHLAEGIETSLALFLSLKKPIRCVVHAQNLSKINPPKTIKTIHIWADKDRSETGEKEAKKAADVYRSFGIKTIIHLPSNPIAPDKKSFDFLDLYVQSPNSIVDYYEAAAKSVGPKKIDTPNYPLPVMDESYFPKTIREWVFKHSDRLDVSPDIVAVPLISVISSIIGKQLRIRPKQNDTWTVTPNLWAIVIASPGTRKTPAINLSIDILNKVENDIDLCFKDKRDKNEIEVMLAKDEIKALKETLRKTAKDLSKEEKKELSRQLYELQSNLRDLEVPKKRLSTNSATIEKIIDIISQSPNGLLVFRDEISAIFNSFHKNGRETDRQFYLEGWNGSDNTFKYDTLIRGEIEVKGLCLTLLGGTQPSIMSHMLLEMTQGGVNDGFLSRFQLIAYPNDRKNRDFVDKEAPIELDKKVYRLLSQIECLDTNKHGMFDGISPQAYVKLDQDSYNLFADYLSKLEKEMGSLEDNLYKNHISKFYKLLPSLILIFHIIDNIENSKSSGSAKLHVVEMAIKWCELQKAHAKKLYDFNYNIQNVSGYALAKKIVRGDVKDGATIRSIYINEWSHLQTTAQVEAAAKFLEDHGWLSQLEKRSDKGGRPSMYLKFHPDLAEFLSTQEWSLENYS